jgi:hypothetical protein
MTKPDDLPAPRCTLLTESQRYRTKVVRSLRSDGRDLIVEIQGEAMSFARVVFHDVRGFRVLDEGDLLEFWNTYSEPNGWLWEVHAGGWLDLERRRPRFNLLSLPLREFFVVDDPCISVLCERQPTIEDLGAAPPA